MSEVFIANGILEGMTGLLGIVGSITQWYPGSGVMFQIVDPNEAEYVIFNHVYIALALLAGASSFGIFFSKAAHNNTGVLIAYSFGGLLYHFLTASFLLTALVDPLNPALPYPNVKLFQRVLRFSPLWAILAEYIDTMSKQDIRYAAGTIGALLHVILGVWFVVSIVSFSTEWKDGTEEEIETAAPVQASQGKKGSKK